MSKISNIVISALRERGWQCQKELKNLKLDLARKEKDYEDAKWETRQKIFELAALAEFLNENTSDGTDYVAEFGLRCEK